MSTTDPARDNQGPRYTRRKLLIAGSVGAASMYFAGGAAASSSNNVTVTFDMEYAGTPGSMQRFWTLLAARAAKANRGFTLTTSFVPYANLDARLQSNHAARQGSTLETYYADFPLYPYIVQGAITPVDPYLSGNDKPSDWLFILDQKINGKYWGVPFYGEQALLAANIAQLHKAGVDVGPNGFPSWTAFTQACAKLKKAGSTPVMMGASDGYNAEKWMLAAEMTGIASLKTLGQFALNDLPVTAPGVSTWADWFQELHKNKWNNSDAANITEQQAITNFLNGKGAMMMLYPGAIFTAKNHADYRIIGFPRGPGPLSAGAAVAADLLMMTSYGANKPAAAKFLTWLQEPAQLALFNQTTGEFPCNTKFDASHLPPLPKQAWDLLTKSKPTPTWAHNYIPREHVAILYDIGPKSVGGAAPAAIRKEYVQKMDAWRSGSTAEVQLLQKFVQGL